MNDRFTINGLVDLGGNDIVWCRLSRYVAFTVEEDHVFDTVYDYVLSMQYRDKIESVTFADVHYWEDMSTIKKALAVFDDFCERCSGASGLK